MSRYTLMAAAIAVTSMGSGTDLLAQGVPAYLFVQEVEVARGHRAAFEETVTQIHQAYTQTGAEPQRVGTYVVRNGADYRRYLFVVGLNEISELDDFVPVPEALRRAYGEEEAARILKRSDESIESLQVSISMTQMEVTSATGQSGPAPGMATVIRTAIDLDHHDDYMLYLSKLAEAERAADVSWARRRVIRGDLTVFTAVRLFDRYSDSVPPPYELLREHYGDLEANDLIDRQRRAVVHREIETLQFRPDLSRGTPR